MAEPIVLPLSVEEAPEITDALIVAAVHMKAVLDWQRDVQAAAFAVAEAAERGDLASLSRAARRFAEAPTSAERIPALAQSAADLYRLPGRTAGLPDPAMDARIRRGLHKITPWFEKRWWPLFGGAAEPPPAGAPAFKRKACRRAMRDRLSLLDEEILRLAADPRDRAHTARLMMVTDRNAHAARCRACGRCPLATDRLTAPLPTP
jgi:hypothetical protein